MAGNQRFAELVGIINSRNYKFPFDISDKKGVRGVAEIRNRILEERARGSTETIDFFGECFLDPEIQGILNIKQPQIKDFNELLGLERGKVYGLELRLMGPAGSHKDLMMGSLIVMQIMANGFTNKEKNTLTDAGFFNSALATKYYAKRFGLKGTYFMPEDVPPHLIRSLEERYNFEVVRVPLPTADSKTDKKNATFKALLRRFMKDKDFERRTYHLGHAELGLFSTIPYGRAFVKLFKQKGITPDIFLTGVGAGTTLLGLGEPMQDAYGTELNILEYEEHGPVKAKIPDKFKGVINPGLQIIPADIKNQARSIDEALLAYLRNQGYSTGITSASCLAAGAYLAERENKTVIVPIFERFRDYTSNARHILSRQIQLNPGIPEDFWKRVGRVYHLEKKK